MSARLKNKKLSIILNITVATWATVMFLLLPACNNNKKNIAEAVNEKDSLPDMRTTGVTTYISDSGMIRYKIITDEWLIYSQKNPPYWAFEKGVYMETIQKIALIFTIIGAIVWLLIGLFDFNLVDYLFVELLNVGFLAVPPVAYLVIKTHGFFEF